MMSMHQRSLSAAGGREKTPFEQQREALIGEIAMVRHAEKQNGGIKKEDENGTRHMHTFAGDSSYLFFCLAFVLSRLSA